MLTLLRTISSLTLELQSALDAKDISRFDQLNAKRHQLINALSSKLPTLDEAASLEAEIALRDITNLNDKIIEQAQAVKGEVYGRIRKSNLSKKMNAAYKT